jgi:glucosamine--fructose-6-phosphate aminotransferase (isomerizing)
MCGIIGYIGKESALPFIIDGLRRESYRGYDSSGVVVFDGESVQCLKSIGTLEQLEKKLAKQPVLGTMGLGHNRWATHGGVTEKNAHPHADCNGNIFVTHNGIIENYQSLKDSLQKDGHVFVSKTDTEVLPHLIESFFTGNLEEAVRKALRQVKGAYAIAVAAKQDPGKIVAARFSAPLVLSVNASGGFVASDPAAIVNQGNNIVFLEDGDVATVTADGYAVTDLKGKLKKRPASVVTSNQQEAERGNYAHFMLKEISEHAESIRSALAGRVLAAEGMVQLEELAGIAKNLHGITSVTIIACGGSLYAAGLGEYILEEYGGLPTRIFAASEFRYRASVFDKKTLYVFISQSGETADTLAALREVKKQGGVTIGIVNVAGSTMDREVEASIHLRSGLEIAVASTKTFSAQLICLYLLALFLGQQRKVLPVQRKRIIKEFSKLPLLVEKILTQRSAIQKVARNYQSFQKMCIIGRKYSYPIALEGALKLKEVAYIHGEGIEGGELKHGFLSLIGTDFPTIALVPTDSVYEKTISNIQEIKARNGAVIAIASEGDTKIAAIADDVLYIPKALEVLNPILATVCLHLLSYESAVLRDCEIDKPRNLAKSVTVE